MCYKKETKAGITYSSYRGNSHVTVGEPGVREAGGQENSGLEVVPSTQSLE